MTWTPREDTEAILDFAMTKIHSVPYKVSTRWLFYRVLQAGLIRDKKEIHKFDYAINRARHEFYGEWTPDTLIDSVRECYWDGEFLAHFLIRFDSIEDQDYYVQCWFEAEAMHGQFNYYASPYRVSLIPFRGELSIPMKWEIAKKLEEIDKEYNKPIKILYFGDYDRKGFSIIKAALEDIREWCCEDVDFSVERVGLTLEQAQAFHLNENPDMPDSYQWEALEDAQAAQLIQNSLNQYAKRIPKILVQREKLANDRVRGFIKDLLTLEGIATQ